MVWYVRHLEVHVLGANHWCVEVEVFDVDGHESCTFCGDDTVEENLGGQHVSCGCAAIARISNSVAANRKADAIWVIFLRSVVCNKTSIRDVFSVVRWYLVGWDEDYSVGSLYCAGLLCVCRTQLCD